MNKYFLYERSVQSPEPHLEMFQSIFKEIRGTQAYSLREDFCGTFQFSYEWIKSNPKNSVICVDLDSEPLQYGKQNHLRYLDAQQKKKIKLVQADLLQLISRPSDLIIACNFSFFVFKTRKLLLTYFKNVLKSLNKNGILILEIAGGPGMITRSKEQKTIYLENKEKFTYIWDQNYYDPIQSEAHYSIHFRLQDGKILKDAFTYDWRLWSIPEVRELLADAGFKKTYVYWETEHKGVGTGEYVQSEKGDNAFAWIAYIAAAR